MNNLQERVAGSFNSQGLMATFGAITSIVDNACGYAALTKAPAEHEIVTAEFKINFMQPALGERFLAIGTVKSSRKLLTVCTGEVRVFS